MTDFIDADPSAPAGFPFPEKIARQKAGLSEDDMRALRNAKLKLDVDFRYHKKAIFLSQPALEKIAPTLTPRFPEKTPPAANGERPGPIAGEVVKLLIVRTDLSNRHMLSACAVGEDPDRPQKTLRVRVRSQEGFRKRTTIEARLVSGYSDMYDLVSRYPRKKTNL